MIGRVPRHTSLGDDIQPGDLFVFIPGAIASGFLQTKSVTARAPVAERATDSGGRRSTA